MNILAIETTTGFISGAILVDGKLYSAELKEKNSQSEKLPGFLTGLLDKAKVQLSEVDIFACTTGPGSFTGIRSGLGFLQGVAYSQGKQLVGVTVFELLKDDAEEGNIVVAAGKGNYYCRQISEGAELEAVKILAEEEIKSLPNVINKNESGHIVGPTAELICNYLKNKEKIEMSRSVAPVYVKKPQAEIDFKG